MTRKTNPCHGCGNRSAGCHATCERYAAYDKERRREREEDRRRAEESNDLYRVRGRIYRRWPRKRAPDGMKNL